MGTGVDVDRLDGFRPPVGDERVKYSEECVRIINSESIPIIIWLIIVSPVCILMWLSLIGYITNENLIINGEFMILLLIVLCMTVIEYFLLNSLNTGKLKKRDLRKGNFWVLNCKAYDGSIVTDTTGGELFIETLSGQKCRQSFLVGTDLATDCCKYLESDGAVNDWSDDYVPLVLISCCFDYWILRR